MGAEVWYRKWRPQTFSEVTGQEHVTRTLANAVAQGRVSHAYLLCGPRGTGKTTTARLLAKAVNCERPNAGEPCDECESCRAVTEGRALDLVEMDAASNRGIDDIRNLRDRVGYHPTVGQYRVYLIDEVHELTAQAFDALLKTLEEPPAHVIFVLATTDAHRVPATIVSRCQRFDLTRVKLSDISARLAHIAAAEGVAAEPDALDAIARAATGSLRDAVNLLEQLVATHGDTLTARDAQESLGLITDARARTLASHAAAGRFLEGLELIAAVADDGVDIRRFGRQVVAELRALLLMQAGAESGLEGHGAEALADLRRAAADLEPRRVLRALKAFSGAEYRGEGPAALPLELALAEVAFVAEEPVTAERPTTAPAASAPPAQSPAPTPITAAPSAGRLVGSAAARAILAPAAPLPTAAPAAPASRPPEPTPLSARATAATLAPEPMEPIAERPSASSGGATMGEPIVPPPAPPPPLGDDGGDDGPLSVERARLQFRAIYEACRAKHTQTGGLLNSGCDIVALDARTITFGFRHDTLLARLLPGTQAHRVLSEAIRQVLGQPLDVHCTHVADVTDRLRANPPRPSHLLDEARKLGLEPV